jgi:hypothetical protein
MVRFVYLIVRGPLVETRSGEHVGANEVYAYAAPDRYRRADQVQK